MRWGAGGAGVLGIAAAQGLWWNLMAVAVVVLGAVLCVGIGVLLPHIGITGSVGLFAGATPECAAFGSATEAIRSVAGSEATTRSVG